MYYLVYVYVATLPPPVAALPPPEVLALPPPEVLTFELLDVVVIFPP